jgi:hypothetical protein
MLVAEEDDLIFEQRRADFPNEGVRQRLREVDPRYFRAERACNRRDPDRALSHRIASIIDVAKPLTSTIRFP